MKMEHAVVSDDAGKIQNVTVRVGETVTAGTPLVVIEPSEHDGPGGRQLAEADLGEIRPDLGEAIQRHHIGSDEYRRVGPSGATRKGAGPPARTSATWSTTAASSSTARWPSPPSAGAARWTT